MKEKPPFIILKSQLQLVLPDEDWLHYPNTRIRIEIQRVIFSAFAVPQIQYTVSVKPV